LSPLTLAVSLRVLSRRSSFQGSPSFKSSFSPFPFLTFTSLGCGFTSSLLTLSAFFQWHFDCQQISFRTSSFFRWTLFILFILHIKVPSMKLLFLNFWQSLFSFRFFQVSPLPPPVSHVGFFSYAIRSDPFSEEFVSSHFFLERAFPRFELPLASLWFLWVCDWYAGLHISTPAFRSLPAQTFLPILLRLSIGRRVVGL